MSDVPALVGKTIEQLAAALGKPDGPDAPNLTVDELERRYRRDGCRLVVTYDAKTRQTTGFFLSAPDPPGETRDCGKLLEVGNLDPTSTAYGIDSLESNKAGYFTGLV